MIFGRVTDSVLVVTKDDPPKQWTLDLRNAHGEVVTCFLDEHALANLAAPLQTEYLCRDDEG